MDIKYLNAFNLIIKGKIGTFQKLYEACQGDFERAWHSDSYNGLLIKNDLSGDEIRALKKSIDPDQALERLHRESIDILTIYDNTYPRFLKTIFDPPFLLYIRGNREALNTVCLSIVGTRKASEYGQRTVSRIANQIARNGITIVSGLAAGIDTMAHRATLEASGTTIAVLGCGLDTKTIFPQQNVGLARAIIAQGGAIISEYPVGLHGTKFTFPQRNRIISGLSRGTLVVEADVKSGSLITAHSALDQNRDVYAVPGSIFSKVSEGAHELLKQGAYPVTSAEDILENYGIAQTAQQSLPWPGRPIVADNEDEQKILNLLKRNPMTIDELIRQTGLPTATVNSRITMMEIKGKIKNIDNTISIT